MNPNEKVTEIGTLINVVEEDADNPQMPTSLVDFFKKAPHVDLEIPIRTNDDDHRKVEFC